MNYIRSLSLAVSVTLGSVAVVAQVDKSSNPNNDHVWITMGSDAAKKLKNKTSSPIQIKFSNNQLLTTDVSVVSIPKSQIDSLSQFMHEEYNRCGGFFFHDSLQEAQSFIGFDPTITQSVAVNYTIDNPNGVNALLTQMSASNLTSTVNALSNYNNRYYTAQSGVDAANWIKNQWASMASGRSDISVATYGHSWNQPSVIATITGTVSPNEIVVIGGHLDSINQSSPSTGRAPGADDNASGIAVLTETLRSMIASGYKPAKTIKLMGYAAEEVGLRGSKAIAQSFKNAGENVIGVVQFDMSGYKGTSNRDIVFMTDYTNSGQNQFLTQLMDTYLSNLSYGYDQCGYACSDHASWHNQGYAASMPFESNMNDYNSSIHTSSDNSFDANHSLKFAKLSAAYVAELAKGGTGSTPPPPPPPPSDSVLSNGVPITGLSGTTGNEIVYTMLVPSGATNIRFVMNGGSGDADLYTRFGSTPTDSSYDCRPYKNGNTETCTATQAPGTYYVRVKAYSNFSGVTLTGSFTEDNGGGNDPIDETINDISVAQGAWYYHSVTLADGYADLSVTLSGGSGDGDLYVRQGAQPTTSNYNCRPYKWGNAETCSFTSPAGATWHIGIRGYSAASGMTLNIKANP